VDVYTASSVGEAIQSLVVAGAVNVVLDMTSVARVDSSGLGTLVGNSKSIASHGGALCLVGLAGSVRRMLEITNLAGYFRLYDTQREAIEEFEACMAGSVPLPAGGD
jgi:anti-anti-sigma factor